jgi:hypothetical protein
MSILPPAPARFVNGIEAVATEETSSKDNIFTSTLIDFMKIAPGRKYY